MRLPRAPPNLWMPQPCYRPPAWIRPCLLARDNIHLGRADWRSAFRLTGFLFVLTLASWAVSTHHVPARTELIIILMGLSSTLLAVGLMWIMYVALEPFVRRRWPQ